MESKLWREAGGAQQAQPREPFLGTNCSFKRRKNHYVAEDYKRHWLIGLTGHPEARAVPRETGT